MSTLIAPLSGEVIETNDALDGNESTVNDDPYGAGWLVKVRLSDPSEVDIADGCRRLPGATWTRCELHLADRSATSSEMLERIGVGSLEELFADIPEGLRLGRPIWTSGRR